MATENAAATTSRDHFSGKWGFILACVGSAVGMANVWAFPYRVAKYGGAAFLIPYLLCVIVLGCTGVVSETALGRWGQSGPLATFKKAMTEKKKPLKNIGIIPVISSFGIATGYAIIMGWVIRYLVGATSGAMFAAQDTGAYFGAICGNFGSVGWHLLALGITFLMMFGGISKSVEKICKVMMPVFFVLFIYMVIRVGFIPGATEGYKYLFIPQWSALANPTTWVYALGQAFFSLSLAGNGTVIYGSYLDRKENILFTSGSIAVFDTLAAMLAAMVVVPAVFAFDFDLAAGPPLMFITLPAIFQTMEGGRLFSIIFFAAIFFAAASSIVNLFETPIEMVQQKFKLGRVPSVAIIVVLSAICGVFLENGDIVGKWMDIMSIYVCPIGALIAAAIFFWIMGDKFAHDEIQCGRDKPIPGWMVPAGKYLYCFVAIVVIVLGIALGGIG